MVDTEYLTSIEFLSSVFFACGGFVLGCLVNSLMIKRKLRKAVNQGLISFKNNHGHDINIDELFKTLKQ